MSYHILHQFDEQWLADLTHDNEESKEFGSMASGNDKRPSARRTNLAPREINRWIVTMAILIAAFALLFALDANHRAETLQQRLDAVESKMKN